MIRPLTLPLLVLLAGALLHRQARADEPTARPEHAIEPALAERLIEVAEQVVVLELRYGDRHPALLEARRRARLLEAAAAQAPAWLGPVPDELRVPALRFHASFVRRALSALEELAELRTSYGPAHPTLRAAEEKARRLTDLKARLERLLPADVLRPPTRAEELAERVALQGRLDHLLQRYSDKHPRVVAVRSMLAVLDRQQPPAQPSCAEQQRAARQLMARLGERGLDAGEREAALDALAAHLGTRLACAPPAKRPAR